ncbi:hypothetical protein [Pseudomonas alloputida]|uniref:hypothetical protein n=1 Tax=Pseudomonas alloputida TaxID=1940621 RepID=UPI00320AB205
MNKHELILPNEWLVHAVEINLLAYNSSREGYQDLLFLFATDKDGTAHEFTVTAPAMRYVAMEAYNALKTGSVDEVVLRITDVDNHLYALYI